MARKRRSESVKYNTQRVEKPRSEKKKLLIVSEGSVTERIYFDDLKQRYRNSIIEIDFVPNTRIHPIKLVQYAQLKCEEKSLDNTKGDIAYCVFDKDTNPVSNINTAQNIADKSNYCIKLIISNPSFELWYVLHFVYTTKGYTNGNEVYKELQTNYIKGYSKTKSYSEILDQKTENAIKNAKKLEKFHEEEHANRFSRNPYTEVHKIFEKIKSHT